MINHPNRTPAIRARNKWLDASAAWNREATRRFGEDFSEEEGMGEHGSHLRQLYDRMQGARDNYQRFLIPPRQRL